MGGGGITKGGNDMSEPYRSELTIEHDTLTEEILLLLYSKKVSYGKAHKVLESAAQCIRNAVRHELWKEPIRHQISVKNGSLDDKYFSRADEGGNDE